MSTVICDRCDGFGYKIVPVVYSPTTRDVIPWNTRVQNMRKAQYKSQCPKCRGNGVVRIIDMKVTALTDLAQLKAGSIVRHKHSGDAMQVIDVRYGDDGRVLWATVIKVLHVTHPPEWFLIEDAG